jgi:hypothetical protein
MQRQNITLSLPRELIKKAKIVAITRDTSLSNLMRQALEGMVDGDENYQKAMKRHLDILEEGFNLNLKGKIPWTREELHVRKNLS